MTKRRAMLPATVPPSVRRSEILSRLKSVLAEFDLRAQVGRGKHHWFLEVQVGRTPQKHFFSPGSNGPRAIENNAAALRRVLVTARTNIGRSN